MREWKREEFILSMRNSLEEARTASALLRIRMFNDDEGSFIAENSFKPDEVEACMNWVLDNIDAVSCLVLVHKRLMRQPGSDFAQGDRIPRTLDECQKVIDRLRTFQLDDDWLVIEASDPNNGHFVARVHLQFRPAFRVCREYYPVGAPAKWRYVRSIGEDDIGCVLHQFLVQHKETNIELSVFSSDADD